MIELCEYSALQVAMQSANVPVVSYLLDEARMDAAMKTDYATKYSLTSLVAQDGGAIPILKKFVAGGLDIKALDNVQDVFGTVCSEIFLAVAGQAG